ncbi:hypothetical protein BH11BAC7_BH11BAC7_13680 [soil metagenome]
MKELKSIAKRICLLLLAASTFISVTSFKAFYLDVEYDGIYVYKLDEESSAVIRFYEDGVVIVSTSVNDYSKVMTWFNRDKENFSRILSGKCKKGKRDASIRFNVKGETGEQKFTGHILYDKTLELHVVNANDKTSTDRIYKFVKP